MGSLCGAIIRASHRDANNRTARALATNIDLYIHHSSTPLSTGEVINGKKYSFMNVDQAIESVVQHDVRADKIFDASECCRRCGEEFPEAKVWQKSKLDNVCECFSFDDDFDPSNYIENHREYSIGSCE